ncbi:MAG TPA: hypothetical protein VNM48_01500 [Chloroflexota bacterium]|nr:hypothetical protein [Chloroflexota bacterium]
MDAEPSPEQYVDVAEVDGFPDDSDTRRPGERIPVYRLHRQAYARGEIILTTRSLATEAGALSFMGQGPHDVRPAMLLAMYGEDPRALSECLAYGVRYMQAWCLASGVTRGEAATKAAAADALAVVYGARRKRVVGEGTPDRAQVSADDRAWELVMRAASYRELRKVALRMFRKRLREACLAYHAGRIHTRETSYLNIGRSSPPASSSSRAEPRNARQLLQWAA